MYRFSTWWNRSPLDRGVKLPRASFLESALSKREHGKSEIILAMVAGVKKRIDLGEIPRIQRPHANIRAAEKLGEGFQNCRPDRR